jgi:preprotein translocase subunit YajC
MGMGNMEILAATTTTSHGSSYLFPIIIVVLFGVLYFVMIRPQRNRQRQAAQTQNQIVPGQRVRTTAGMYATVVALEDGDVVLEVAPGVKVRYMRRAVMDVVPSDSDTVMNSDGKVDGSTPSVGETGTAAADATEDGSAPN